MAAILDIISSMVFGGMLFIIVLTAQENAIENQSTHHSDMLVQEMLTSTAQLVEGEFRNMGFGVPENQTTILSADSSRIGFLVDLGHNGVIDTIRYILGDTTELRDTQNELDRYLYRSINGSNPAQIGVVTIFKLQFFARSGELFPTPDQDDRLSEIHVVEVTMEVQNPYGLYRSPDQVHAGERDALYSSSLWQQTRLASQNSRR